MYPPSATRRRRWGSSASAPPASLAKPETASLSPSTNPSAAAGAPRTTVMNDARSAVGISCPTSASRLATPIPVTPLVSHGREPSAGDGVVLARSTPARLRSPAQRSVRPAASRPRGAVRVGPAIRHLGDEHVGQPSRASRIRRPLPLWRSRSHGRAGRYAGQQHDDHVVARLGRPLLEVPDQRSDELRGTATRRGRAARPAAAARTARGTPRPRSRSSVTWTACTSSDIVRASLIAWTTSRVTSATGTYTCWRRTAAR